jgi:hypothetical protein
MNELKTGAIICKAADKRNQVAYRPLAFITGVPDSFTDEDLRIQFDISIIGDLASQCPDVLFRADIHSTSNEVQEEYEKLHDDAGTIPTFPFRQRTVFTGIA